MKVSQQVKIAGLCKDVPTWHAADILWTGNIANFKPVLINFYVKLPSMLLPPRVPHSFSIIWGSADQIWAKILLLFPLFSPPMFSETYCMVLFRRSVRRFVIRTPLFPARKWTRPTKHPAAGVRYVNRSRSHLIKYGRLLEDEYVWSIRFRSVGQLLYLTLGEWKAD